MTLRERASMDPTVKVVCIRVLNGALMNRDTPCVDKRVEAATHEFSSASRICRHSVSVHCNFALPAARPRCSAMFVEQIVHQSITFAGHAVDHCGHQFV